MAKTPLTTRWSREVSPTNALPGYPRPQLRRKEWLNLNGLWEYALASGDAAPAYGGKILVPYPLESALSGVGVPSAPDKSLYYRRTFTIPAEWRAGANGGQRVMLHCGAVNYLAEVKVNGQVIKTHRGGFDGFSYEITSALRSGANEIVLRVQNPLRVDVADAQVVGKQRDRSGGIFYTAATGIWQTIWLEPVNANRIQSLRITANIDAGEVEIEATVPNPNSSGSIVEVDVMDGGRRIATGGGNTLSAFRVKIPHPRLWTPETPHLYDLKVRYRLPDAMVDEVESYFAMRKISLGKDQKGRTTILLNNKPYFQVGTLDQGYWPDGIYTAPTDAALKWDIEATKRLGFNLIRKHAKVEPDRWYYWADKLGMLVWQDMPQAFGQPREGVEGGVISDEGKRQWETEWRRIMDALHNHPSIVTWTTFNEGWGQHDTERIAALTKELDPSRLVNSVSGWVDKGVGDLDDVHDYPGPGSHAPSATRAAVNGEFGGITRRIPGHMWTEDVFGYGATLDSEWSVTKRYQDLMRRAYALHAERGTSAVVYTQITDVEQESNGLLTYDRAVWKADARIVAAANRGRFLPMGPNPNPPILRTSAEEAQRWQYTLTDPGSDWTAPTFPDKRWAAGPAPFGQGLDGVRTPWQTSDIWLRREVVLPPALPKDLAFTVLYDEDVEIWVNGVLAASAKGYTGGYVTLPMTPAGRAALRTGRNLIAVHCRQSTGAQAIDLGIVRVIRR